MKLSIGVTGHRDLLEEQVPALEDRVRSFFGDLKMWFPGLELQLISPLAKGADRLVGRVALELGIELVAVLPMERQEYEHDFDTPEDLSSFKAMHREAVQTITLPLAEGTPPGSLQQGSAERNRQYAQLGLFLSNHCQILLALWDGHESEDVGGTAQVVRYHLTAAMTGFVDEQASADLLADNENDLVYHIVCSRARRPRPPPDGLAPLEGWWITSLYGRQNTPCMPSEYRLMLERLQEFDDDGEKYVTKILSESYPVLEDLPDVPLPPGVKEADWQFREADWLAIHFQKRVHFSLLSTYFLAATMGTVFLVYSEFGGPRWMVLIFLALFFGGMVLHFIGERREWHRKYLDYRALAEGLRVQIYWNLAGVVNPFSVGFAYDSFLNKQDVDLGWMRHVMRSVSMIRARGAKPDSAWLDWVIDHWIGREEDGTGQLAYYSQKKLQNVIHNRRTSLLGRICLWSGISVAFLMFVVGNTASEDQVNIMMLLMGALPLIAGIRDAYAHKKAEKRLIRQYDFMSRIFGNARKLLDTSDEPGFQMRVLRALGEAALEEGAQWILVHRERPLEYSGL